MFILVFVLLLLLSSAICVPEFRVAREEGIRRETYFYHIGDGLYYHVNVEREGTIYYKCVLSERGCYGRAVFDIVDGFIHTSEHNHDPDPIYPDEMALRRNILRRCRQLEYVCYHDILQQESRW